MKIVFHFLLTDRQVSGFCKVFAYNISSNINLSKTHALKIIQLAGFLGKVLGTLMKAVLPFMKKVPAGKYWFPGRPDDDPL